MNAIEPLKRTSGSRKATQAIAPTSFARTGFLKNDISAMQLFSYRLTIME